MAFLCPAPSYDENRVLNDEEKTLEAACEAFKKSKLYRENFATSDYITAEYVYREDGSYGAQVSWALEKNEWFVDFVLMRYADSLGSSYMQINTSDFSYFDPIEPGTYYYRVLAEYNVGGGVSQQSAFAPNLYDPELDYAVVEVTLVSEQSVKAFAYPNPVSEMLHWEAEGWVEAYNALGERIYQGDASVVDVSEWNSGIYFLRMTTASGTITQKIIKK